MNVPLFFTRQFLYGSIIFTSLFLVLLPSSVVTYLNFYKTMIPTERVSAPARFLSLPDQRGKESHLNLDHVMPFLRQHSDLDFAVNLNLKAICRLEKLFQVLSYLFTIDPQHLYSGEFLVNCDSRYIYVAKNRWIPYNLRYWTPPVLVDILKLVLVEEPLLTMRGNELMLLLEKQTKAPVFVFDDTSAVLIDSKQSTLDFVIQWDGLRYYLVNFYWTSLIIGAGSIWVCSSFFCLLATLVSLLYFTGSKVKQE